MSPTKQYAWVLRRRGKTIRVRSRCLQIRSGGADLAAERFRSFDTSLTRAPTSPARIGLFDNWGDAFAFWLFADCWQHVFGLKPERAFVDSDWVRFFSLFDLAPFLDSSFVLAP